MARTEGMQLFGSRRGIESEVGDEFGDGFPKGTSDWGKRGD